jgi:thiol-disulfide isomerase/thioredoxin
MRFARPLLALVATTLVATACGEGGGGAGPASTTILPSPKARNAAAAPLLPTDRYALPALDPQGFDQLLSQLRGTPVIVNVWASWCGPCRVEAPHLARVAHRYGDHIQFLGIDLQDQRDPARTFIRDAGWPYPSVFDASGAIRNSLGFFGQPVTIFLDRDGNRAALTEAGNRVTAWSGPVPQAVLDRMARRLVGS